MRRFRQTGWCTLCVLFCSVAAADDWPQWLGPERDSVYRESGVIRSIPEDGLEQKWSADVAWGYSGPAVADGKVFVTDYVIESGELVNNPGGRNELTGRERVLCFNAETGEPLWEHSDPQEYFISYAGGPRATPTVDGEHVYTLGAEGLLLCLKVDSGDVAWSLDLNDEYHAETPFWGYSAAPLVHGGLLYTLAGGEGSVVAALNKHTGEEQWRALSAPTVGYCPPTMIDTAGGPLLAVWHPEAINGLNPETGEVLWSIELEPSYGMSVTAPRQFEQYLYASGIGFAAALLELAESGSDAEVVWRGEGNEPLYCSNSTPLLQERTIYGNGCFQGELAAVDMLTGERLWETYEATTQGRPQRHATVFLVKHGEADDRYFLFNEHGELILADLTRDGYEEHGRAKLLEPTNEAFGREVVWTHPAFANCSVFVRNDKELVCVDIEAN